MYAVTRFGANPTAQQEELLESLAPEGARVACRAGHGVGKTRSLGIALWWFLECFDRAKAPCTAPTASQLHTVLWSEVSALLRRAEEQADKLKLPSAIRLGRMFRVLQDRIYEVKQPKEWFAIARTSRKEAPDALQGYHASDVDVEWIEEIVGGVPTRKEIAVERSDSGGSILFLIDEASGVPDEVIHVVEGALASHRSRLVMCGNPTKASGFFYDAFHTQRSFHTCLRFPTSKSPLPPENYRPDLVRKYGEGSNIVRVRADGEFPRQDDDALIGLDLTEAALARPVLPDDPTAPLIMGVDVARQGADRTVYILRKGRRLVHLEVHRRQDTMETTGQVKALFDHYRPARVCVDANGMGWGPVDRLKELGVPVVGVMVSETATLPPIVRTRASAKSREPRYSSQVAVPRTVRDYVWLGVLDWLQNDDPSFAEIDGDDAKDLAAELCTVNYGFDSSGKIVVESKDARKKRLKDSAGVGHSPDLADALCMTFAPDAGGSIWERMDD